VVLKMPQFINNRDEIKRKLRELKKIEIKMRFQDYELYNNKTKSSKEMKNVELVWNQFFTLKEEAVKNVKYSLDQLSSMTKEEFKEVINEYFYHLIYRHYYESGFRDTFMIDPKVLTRFGLPITTDITEIKRRFRELAKRYHPDNGGDRSKFMDLMEEYKNLKNE